MNRVLAVLLLLPFLSLPTLLGGQERPVAQVKDAGAIAKLKATSLGLAPENAAFHYASLRLKEQVEWLMATKTVAKIRALPMVQEGLKKLEEEWKTGQDFSPFRRFLAVKENQELLDLVLEMGGQEIFFTGGENITDFLGLAGNVFAAVQTAPLGLLLENGILGIGDPEAMNKAQMQAVLDELAAAVEDETLQVPDFVVGFKISSKEKAKTQLTRLENLVKFALNAVPQLQGRVERVAKAEGDFLVLKLDGSMVPWNEIPFKEYEEDPGDYDDLQEALKKLTLSISLGIKGDYILLGIGASPEFVQKLGSGKTLAERDEFKPLHAHAGKPLTSLSYTSKALRMLSAYDVEEYEDAIEGMAEGLLVLLELPDKKAEKLTEDLKQMVRDLEPFQTRPGASVGCSFTTPRGQEGFSYDYSIYPTSDASKPLTLTQHLGGSPIFAYVGRGKLGAESWANFAKWTKKGYAWFDELAAPKMPDEMREKYKEIMEWAGPLFARLETTTRTKFIPALADSQTAFVLDGKLKSKQWFAQMPEAEQPVTAPELALLFGVTDAELLKSAMSDYRTITNEFIEKGIALSGGLVPEFRIAEPQTKTLASGTAYFYPLPEEVDALGIDKQLQPAAGLSAKVATLSLSLSHTERLMTPTPLAYGSGLPMDLARPASSFMVFDFLSLHDAVEPWINYAAKQMEGELNEEQTKQFKEYFPQTRTILECSKLLRRYVSLSYQENGVWVTHSVTEVKDLE